MIRFSNVSKRYPGGFEALSNISFHMEKGAMAFLTGHSGAGKSTMLKLIALIERASRGQIFLDGENVTGLGTRRIPYIRRKIGFIFQDHHLLFDRTVFDNVALPLVIAGYRHQEIGRRVRAALDKLGLLSKEKLHPVTLSSRCPAVSSSVSASRAPWSTSRCCCWRTNRPAISTPICHVRSCSCSACSMTSVSVCWSPRTMST